MRIFIETDLEGISGISSIDEIERRDPHGLERLMADLNAAVSGVFDAGADEVYVTDGHGGGNNFIHELLDKRARQVSASADDLVGCDAAFIIGAHAIAGSENAFLDHTQSSVAWHNYYINGCRHGEMGQLAAYAGAFGIPLVMVSGDLAACAEARALFGDVETAVVKYANGRNRARCIPVAEAERLIHDAAYRAVADLPHGRVKPYRVSLPARVVVEYNRSDYCDNAMKSGRLERLDARTIQKTVNQISCYADLLP